MLTVEMGVGNQLTVSQHNSNGHVTLNNNITLLYITV